MVWCSSYSTNLFFILSQRWRGTVAIFDERHSVAVSMAGRSYRQHHLSVRPSICPSQAATTSRECWKLDNCLRWSQRCSQLSELTCCWSVCSCCWSVCSCCWSVCSCCWFVCSCCWSVCLFRGHLVLCTYYMCIEQDSKRKIFRSFFQRNCILTYIDFIVWIFVDKTLQTRRSA